MEIFIRKGVDPSGSDPCVLSPNPNREAKGKLPSNTCRIMPLGKKTKMKLCVCVCALYTYAYESKTMTKENVVISERKGEK